MKYSDDVHGRRAFALPSARLQYGPDKTVHVEHIDVHVTPDLEAQTLDAICTTTVRALDEAVGRLTLNAVDFSVHRVERDGQPLQFTRHDGTLDVHFAPSLQPGEIASIVVSYRVEKPRHGVFFIEPTREYPNKVRHVWTQNQDENARYWIPCLDYPHAKQSTSTTIVVPKGQFALSNGALIERKDLGATTSFSYRQDIPHSTYLITFVVGPFSEIKQRAAGANAVPVAYYVLPGREADGERAFGDTPRMIDVFEERIGTPYPFARYSQIAVGDFIFGGMENSSATTQTDRTLHDAIAHLDFSSDPLVSHELAHQWFGDLVTCRDWSHAWLNEGFATYFECIWREASLGYDEYLYDVFGCVARYLDEDASRYRRPIVCNRFTHPIELFDRHLYEKGGSVLHMLRGELGTDRFWRAIRHYVRQNAQRSVETIDLIRAIEESTGRNLRGFFDQWIFRGGHPELEVSVNWDEKRKTATVTVDQKQTIDADHPAYTFDVDLGIVSEPDVRVRTNFGAGPLPGERRLRMHVERAHETIVIPLDAEPKLLRFDPGAFVLASVTYLYPADFATATLRGDPDPVARIRAVRALTKDASHAARAALHVAFSEEPFWGVLEEAAAALGKTKSAWARDLLVASLGHPHPKVRRAVAAALGSFREASVATALLAPAANDASYFVRAAALTSLGSTRDPRAFAVLKDALDGQSWNGIVEAGAIRGLVELADQRATDVVIASTALGRDEGVRRAAAASIGRIGETIQSERTRVVDRLAELIDDPMFLVQLSAIGAAEALEDARLLPGLERLANAASDGRIRRDATEAITRINESKTVPAQVSSLRDDLDTVREEQRKIQEKLEALSRS